MKLGLQRFARAACLALLLSLIFSLSIHAQQTAAPAQTLTVEGLKTPVNVRRDERGIPYIQAENTADLMFAQGYVTASDRLWQMDLLRRTARGELAEIFGARVLEEDKRHRIFDFAGICEQVYRVTPTDIRAYLDDYARGVNAYLATLDDKTLPVEFKILQYRPRAWQPQDSLVVGKLFAEALSTTWRYDLTRAAFANAETAKRDFFFPVTSPLDVLVVGSDKAKAKPAAPRRNHAALVRQDENRIAPVSAKVLAAAQEMEEIQARSLARIGLYAESLAASNNWVVSGKRTVTGKPLLANDPHLTASAPNIWYMTQLSAPGFRVAGVTAAGIPGILIGHNDYIAWGSTNLGPDVQDIYLEQFDPQDATRYRAPDGWRKIEVRSEAIKVRKSLASSATDTITQQVKITRNGPILLEQDGKSYAVRWTALEVNPGELTAFLRLDSARNWKEFSAALSNYSGATQNFVYADTEGNIGYYGAGRIPLRKSGNGSVPYDGATDAGEWTGYIPFEQLPHIYNPQSGIIVTANSRVVGTDYPYFLTDAWFAPVRARRIYDVLTAKAKLDTDDFRAAQGDTTSVSGIIFRDSVIALNKSDKALAADADWQKLYAPIASWDGRMQGDSRAALIAFELRQDFRQRMLEAAFGKELAASYGWGAEAVWIDKLIAGRPAAFLPPEYKTYGEMLRAIARDTNANLVKRYGADETKWTLGARFRVTFPHPLAAAPLIGGQFAIAPFPQNGAGFSLASPNVGINVSMRYIADLSAWDKTQLGIPLGESGDPKNKHWSDQLEDWRNITLRVFPYTEKPVVAAAQETVKLQPR